MDRMVAEPRQRVVGCRAALNRGPDCLAPLSIKLHLPESTGCWCGPAKMAKSQYGLASDEAKRAPTRPPPSAGSAPRVLVLCK